MSSEHRMLRTHRAAAYGLAQHIFNWFLALLVCALQFRRLQRGPLRKIVEDVTHMFRLRTALSSYMHVPAWTHPDPLVTTPPYGGGDGAAEVDETAYFCVHNHVGPCSDAFG